MRKKIVTQRGIFDQSIEQLITLIPPERVLEQVDAVISKNCQIISRVHEHNRWGFKQRPTGAALFQAISRRYFQILKASGNFKLSQLPSRHRCDIYETLDPITF
jgi:hypothetical protein